MNRPALVVLASLPLLSCGPSDALVPDASVDDGGAGADGVADVVDGSTDEGAIDADSGFPIYNVVDGGGLLDGDSSVCHSGLQVTQSCCNGQLCRGFCEGLADGAIQCSCFGIVEGCDEGQVCCRAFRGCASINVCINQK